MSHRTHKEVSTVLSRAPLGLAAPQVRVEVHLGPGLPAFALVGLPEAVVRESKERVRSALLTSGFEFPTGRITVNLSPADLPKEGGRFDLPIAVGILAADRKISSRALQQREFYGELSLGGELRQTPKLLPALVEGMRAGREMILPSANALEATLVQPAKLRLADHLRQVCDALKGSAGLPGLAVSPGMEVSPGIDPTAIVMPDLAEVRGQFQAKRALEIAAAGEHGLLMIGPPGAGKTLLAQRLPGLLPPLSPLEALEVAASDRFAARNTRPPSPRSSAAARCGPASSRWPT